MDITSPQLVFMYDFNTGERVMQTLGNVSAKQLVKFVENCGSDLISLTFFEFMDKIKDDKLRADIDKELAEFATQYQLKLKKKPFVSPLEGWSNVPKGNF